MVKAVFGSQHSTLPEWKATLGACERVLSTTRVAEVLPLIRYAEEAALSGFHVALMLTYEAAAAFEPALKTHSPSSLPIAWAGIFQSDNEEDQPSSGSYDVGPWTPAISRADYNLAVQTIHGQIRDGSTYQVNYCFPLVTRFSGDASSWYRDLCDAQSAQYCAFLDLGRYQIISLSPELFFAKTGDHVLTRPMKGTTRRGRWTTEDETLANYLRNSEKDKAENVMIVDLLRNDLGKVSVPGTVRVSELFKLERYETLWQLTSTVESTLEPRTNLAQLLAALFPCGSITGAPKIRTMEIIRQLEPFPRETYTGAIGLLKPGGDCVFSVAIRTVVLDSATGVATFGVGGGVTIDSTAGREYEECLLKSKFLTAARLRFDLFETLLLEDNDYFLLERHLERLGDSAAYFGFDFSLDRVVQALNETRSKYGQGRRKVRLSLARDGAVRVEAMALSTPCAKPLKVVLAPTAVDSADPLLFHKTTSRVRYESELQRATGYDDVLFFNEVGHVTESTIANIVARIDDKLFTPPVADGLLAGTFRAELLATGVVAERSLTSEELRLSSAVYLINSVRKWMAVEIDWQASTAET